MGIYHIVVNETKKEFIEPGDVNDGSIKQGFVLGDVAHLVLFLMREDWRNDHVIVVDDGGGGGANYEKVTEGSEYSDVTKKAIEVFNDYWGSSVTKLHYTPFPVPAS